ncbi:GYF domain protein [Cordyceps fumosorosea ARSEF 2679]|uniref:GYF domain protein n=1 Tax=Cordyceps fumosorosea (strain ARSEF 2679) TaxID=1081104 RepID=A0A167MX76_CORFA|nr:GYF domain protein [Cordyceps fumosorosea ARSEF 2679]OAA54859.1 GYF domain protein [Cordyceps fumosorosea ARSEF 2679]
MQTNLPSSFASAAAGQNANRDPRTGRPDGRGAVGGDWARRDGRSANGTMTFRRASTTPLGQTMQTAPPTDLAAAQSTSAEPAPPVASVEVEPSRYTKDDLLEVFRIQKISDDPSHLFMPGWDPSNINGNSGRGWGKSNENHIPQEPGACWDQNGETTPMAFQEYSFDEKEAFSTDINSPLKPPTQSKETHQPNGSGRKPSISHGTGNAYGVTSPSSATRPSTRRRETVDSNPFSSSGLGSPTGPGRFSSRDDQTFWFNRKAGESKDSDAQDQSADQARDQAKSTLPGLMRANTAGTVGMSSIWPPSNPSTPGAGGFGNFSIGSSTIGDKRIGGTTGGSRLAHLMPKDSSENISARPFDANATTAVPEQSWRTRPRTDTDPFGDDELSGSAMLGGSQDTNPGGNRAPALGTPVKGSAGDFGMAGLNLDDGPNSPSETNPYRSPANHNDGDSTNENKHYSGASQEPGAGFGALPRSFVAGTFDGSDRSQTSSVGAKAYPLGHLSGWPAPGPSTGTPDRDRPNFGAAAFGNSLFGNMGELQSPGLSNLGNVFGPSGSGGLGAGSIGRGSKLGSLFPAAMQAQMQTSDHESGGDGADLRQQGNPLGAIGRGSFPGPPRDTESPMRSNRGVFEELFPSNDANRGLAHMAGSDGSQVPAGQSYTPLAGGLPFGAPAQSELPSAQARQMVMPDRMRWVYLDPQGQVQGPFTGLEMNDWYKANFFTPDLRVKKVEDPEFEPLGQLIRRIGNSREPFLVPQIGIPHGPPVQAGGYNSNTGVIPPLSGVFPSFGRTLTAEEQNNLERRKQEEQYIMAQQRDFVMRQQAMSKFPIHNPGLQHHSSAQSLQSQPSFGNISNPAQQPPALGGLGPFLDLGNGPLLHARAGNELFRQEDIVNLSGHERQMLAAVAPGSEAAAMGEHAGAEDGLRAGLPPIGQLTEDPEGFRDRLQEFEGLRAQHDAEQAAKAEEEEQVVPAARVPEPSAATSRQPGRAGKKKRQSEDESLSLTEQVQIAQAAAAEFALPEELAEPGMPMPFPPPSSSTPLPAPTAQRARSNLPEQFSRSQTATPEVVQPPPLAPWAKEPGQEGQRGPSLKEIQEAEARKAAKAEELAAAQRKAAMEQEGALLRERERAAAAAATAAALPASSTWGHGSPAAGATAWAKPGPQKGVSISASASASSLSKKTLAEIQREEEVRKQKAMQTAIQTGPPTSSIKSYANLASKTNTPITPSPASPAAPPGAGWATVGAGGKVKVPTGPAVPARSTSGAGVKPTPVAARPSPKPSPVIATQRVGPVNSGNTAMDEFNAWTHRELKRGIETDVDIFQSTLEALPLDIGVITDAVYGSSTTMDARHFAEEYVRRKKLAEKGIFEKQASDNRSSSGGWNEVAKKGSGGQQPPREPEASASAMQGASFKVVPGRKKGKK